MQPTLFVQTANLQWLGDCLPYLYLLRVPILTAVILVAVPYLAFRTNMSALLKGLFDVNGIGITVISLLAFLTAWTILLTSELVLVRGHERFTVCNLGLSFKFSWYHLVVGILAIPMVIGAFMNYHANARKFIQGLGLAILGFLISVGILFGATHPTVVGEFEQGFRLQELFSIFGNGYLNKEDMIQNHSMALVLVFILVLIYATIGILKYFFLNSRRFSETVPTLSYVILLMMILCWSFSGLAFF